MSCASSAGWTSGAAHTNASSPRRAWEIVGIVLGFVFFWPLALGYLIWKLAGYPMPAGWRSHLERTFANPFEGSFRTAAPFGGTKQSGIGREGGHEGMLDYLESKYVAVTW